MPSDADAIISSKLIVGMEIHVELRTRTKMFSRAPSPAHDAFDPATPPNTCIDPVVLGLPGALPVMNRAAVEYSVMVGLALGCRIAEHAKWDRKSYFYPDLPKGYQISQYDLPLCFDGSLDLPAVDDKGFFVIDARVVGAGSGSGGGGSGGGGGNGSGGGGNAVTEPARIGIIRAHLEEDAGKLLHDAPGGGVIDFSIADYNRAGTPLLEIVTQPDFRSAEQAVAFAKLLRTICRFVGATLGVMQQGHIRFEPNINCHLTLADGRLVKTPIVEVKNLNSFKSLRGAIEFEAREQPARWLADRREMGRGMKITRGWDDARSVTYVQREKEDAHDYRYFPDPDLIPVRVDADWLDEIRARVPESPIAKFERVVRDAGLAAKEAWTLVEERGTSDFYEAAVDAMVLRGVERARAAKLAANILLQSGLKRANEHADAIAAVRSAEPGAAAAGDLHRDADPSPAGVSSTRTSGVHRLGVTPDEVAQLGSLRDAGEISAAALDELFGALCENPPSIAITAADASPAHSPSRDVRRLAAERSLLIVRDEGAMQAWIAQVLAANAPIVEQIRAGKVQAVGRLVGETMKLAGGTADAKTIREAILKAVGANP